MMNYRLALTAFFIGSLLSWADPDLVEACMCPDSIALEELLLESPGVFIGTVESSSQMTNDLLGERRVQTVSSVEQAARVSVVKVFRGVPRNARVLTVFSASGFGDCGLDYEAGQSYLFMTWPEPFQDRYVQFTDRCHTSPIDLGDAELVAGLYKSLRDIQPLDWVVSFGDKLPPAPVVSGQEPGKWEALIGSETPFVYVLVLVVLMIGLTLVIVSRTRF